MDVWPDTKPKLSAWLDSVRAVLGSLCMLFADGFPVSEDGAPEIIGPHRVHIKAHPGDPLFLHCEAFANCDDSAIIYWLVNGSFPEDTLSSERLVESEESTLEGGTILQRSLLLKNVTSEDLKSTFTCVVTNPAGTAHKHTMLAAARRDCIVGKRRKH
ncbi:interleukin-18-binding protein-like isoform X4 [Micropterus dolomieu]|uniref:interleukin-18-binding protein-like isoform X4 n=1 Tax=Micropterus dolomieu TaxID=147949 RepID=UPI001E8E017E|nr:interleukin-18-binding protein-like isoform X4 [Micropterus dolomieu]